MRIYGDCTVKRDGDQMVVVRADPMIGVSASLLEEGVFGVNADGHLVITGSVVYRPVGFDQGGRVVVCERVSR